MKDAPIPPTVIDAYSWAVLHQDMAEQITGRVWVEPAGPIVTVSFGAPASPAVAAEALVQAPPHHSLEIGTPVPSEVRDQISELFFRSVDRGTPELSSALWELGASLRRVAQALLETCRALWRQRPGAPQ